MDRRRKRRNSLGLLRLLIFLILILPCRASETEQLTEESSQDEEEEKCPMYMLQFIDFKLFFVGILGTLIAAISIAFNSMLFYTFVSSSLLRRRNLTYLTCLSLCDVFIGISYIGIMSIQVYAEYFEILPLYVLWHECLNVAFTVSNITLTTASFLLVSATFERYLQTIRMGKLLRFVSRHRTMGVLVSFLGGILFRGTVFFEIQVFYKPECEGFAATGVTLSELVRNPYYEIFRFWIRRITTIFVPFFVLAYCNAMIVYSLRENQKNKIVKTLILYMTMGHNGEIIQLRSRVRAATRMLIIVVSCYLFANIIDVVIAFLEYTVPEALSNTVFYTVTTDFSSLLSVLSSALRPPIYIANDKLIRQEVYCKICSIYYSLCCSSQTSAKHKAFLSEKRRLVYEQLEQTMMNTPAVNGTPSNRINCKMSVNSNVSKSGIGSLIMARASVVSSMNESLAVNYDVERCNVIYEKALAKYITREPSSASIEDTIVCENPAEADTISIQLDYRTAKKFSKLLKKKISVQTQHSIDENDEQMEELSKVKETESSTSSSEQIITTQGNSKMGEIRSWYSEV